MKHKIKFFATTFVGYTILLALLFLIVKGITKYHVLENVTYFPLYVILNALVFTFIFSLFYNAYSLNGVQKRLRDTLLVYITFLISSTGVTTLLYLLINYILSDTNTAFFSKEFRIVLTLILTSFSMLWKAVIIFGIITFGFTETINHFILKKNKISTPKKLIPYASLAIISFVVILLIVVSLKPKYAYYKTEKIPDTNLQAIIYLQNNELKTLGLSSNQSYTPAYIELQDLEGNILAKQNFFNRCTVQIGEIYFKIENNKLYYTKFSYIDLFDYSYYCFK